jgi:broad specificity phosphatase PhoE
VVACHGGVVVHSMLHFLSLDEQSAPKRAWLEATNTSLTEFRFGPNPYLKHMRPVQLVRFNDAAHLGR